MLGRNNLKLESKFDLESFFKENKKAFNKALDKAIKKGFFAKYNTISDSEKLGFLRSKCAEIYKILSPLKLLPNTESNSKLLDMLAVSYIFLLMKEPTESDITLLSTMNNKWDSIKDSSQVLRSFLIHHLKDHDSLINETNDINIKCAILSCTHILYDQIIHTIINNQKTSHLVPIRKNFSEIINLMSEINEFYKVNRITPTFTLKNTTNAVLCSALNNLCTHDLLIEKLPKLISDVPVLCDQIRMIGYHKSCPELILSNFIIEAWTNDKFIEAFYGNYHSKIYINDFLEMLVFGFTIKHINDINFERYHAHISKLPVSYESLLIELYFTSIYEAQNKKLNITTFPKTIEKLKTYVLSNNLHKTQTTVPFNNFMQEHFSQVLKLMITGLCEWAYNTPEEFNKENNAIVNIINNYDCFYQIGWHSDNPKRTLTIYKMLLTETQKYISDNNYIPTYCIYTYGDSQIDLMLLDNFSDIIKAVKDQGNDKITEKCLENYIKRVKIGLDKNSKCFKIALDEIIQHYFDLKQYNSNFFRMIMPFLSDEDQTKCKNFTHYIECYLSYNNKKQTIAENIKISEEYLQLQMNNKLVYVHFKDIKMLESALWTDKEKRVALESKDALFLLTNEIRFRRFYQLHKIYEIFKSKKIKSVSDIKLSDNELEQKNKFFTESANLFDIISSLVSEDGSIPISMNSKEFSNIITELELITKFGDWFYLSPSFIITESRAVYKAEDFMITLTSGESVNLFEKLIENHKAIQQKKDELNAKIKFRALQIDKEDSRAEKSFRGDFSYSQSYSQAPSMSMSFRANVYPNNPNEAEIQEALKNEGYQVIKVHGSNTYVAINVNELKLGNYTSNFLEALKKTAEKGYTKDRHDGLRKRKHTYSLRPTGGSNIDDRLESTKMIVSNNGTKFVILDRVVSHKESKKNPSKMKTMSLNDLSAKQIQKV
ncbi:MAG: hypothetical protein J0G32_02060 [Alphaproteobacteria bacterium]|nr:hypothetical protein [Alphaproteobacteria bacterium]